MAVGTAEGKVANQTAHHVENRRHKQKGDAVQSVAGSVDTVNRKVTAADWPPGNEAPRTTRSGLVPREAVSNLGYSPCAIAGMANRCLIGRPGPSISLPSAANLNGLAGLDESAFTPNWQMICVGQGGFSGFPRAFQSRAIDAQPARRRVAGAPRHARRVGGQRVESRVAPAMRRMHRYRAANDAVSRRCRQAGHSCADSGWPRQGKGKLRSKLGRTSRCARITLAAS